MRIVSYLIGYLIIFTTYLISENIGNTFLRIAVFVLSMLLGGFAGLGGLIYIDSFGQDLTKMWIGTVLVSVGLLSMIYRDRIKNAKTKES